ncbi:hypothetical protein BAE44_0007830 [Dichanthelium oligosanthes]|uniref:KIB1-4 beta-propeller domain-containing protein n=1 Tax=Dichanthelium oligosanthes TaxID=888268 RepID=A0A1E5W1D5_9POAL|nr:hypothetical protein BAE44_0007830 [Dichanthelium oligosanthes]
MRIPPSRRAAMAAAPPPDHGAARAPPNFRPGDIIIASLAPHLRFADHLVHRIVNRTWRRSCRLIGRAPPPFPWLMLPPPAATARGPAPAPGAPERRVFYDIPGGRSYAYPVPASYRYVASRSGWLVLAAPGPPRRLVVLNPITAARLDLSWPFGEDPVEGFHAVMTASLADPACFLAIATDRVVKYCRPVLGGGWATLRVPGFRYDTACSDLVSVGATVYLMDERRKLWRADLAAAEPKVERRDTSFVLPQQGDIRWRHYLVESLGHVLFVVSDDHHKRLALYRLNWDARLWVRAPASALGDTVLLLGRGCSAAVPASAASGRSPGTVLVVCQPWRSTVLHTGLNFSGGGGEQQPWFWTESRLGAGLDDVQLVMRKTVPQRPGMFTTGDSFWFFPAIDQSDCP